MRYTANAAIAALCLMVLAIANATPGVQSLPVGSPIYVETIVLTSTWDLRNESGLDIRGAGGQIINYSLRNKDTRFPDRASRIIWRGPADQPVIRTSGVGNHFEALTFIFETPAIAGIHIVDAQGLGSGKHVIERCSFIENPANRRQTPGVLLGGDTNRNADCTTLRDCIAVDCASLVRITQSQSVGVQTANCQTIRCGTAFDFQASGKFAAFGHRSVADKKILTVNAAGSNVNHYEIYGLSVDAQAPDDFVVIDNQLGKAMSVVITGKLSANAARPRADLVCNDVAGINLSGLVGVK